jgi:hypothetical protein
MRLQLTAVGLACATLLAGCGGGGSGAGAGAGLAQAHSFPFPGGPMVAAPPNVATVKLTATASSGGPITYVSNTPTVCTISGDTVSLVKAGECSLSANQAGGNGYAPATQRQLFVVPKNDQAILGFLNPGSQPVGASVQLAATSSQGSLADFPITFTTSTPAVCSVTGTTVQALADGLCLVTAAQAGSDYFNAASLTKTIPVGAAQAPALTFASGYKPSDIGRTAENGKIDWYSSDSNKNTVAADGSTRTFSMDKQSSAPDFGGYFGLVVYAAAMDGLVAGANTTTGVRIDSQKAIKFNLMMNPEMVAAQKTQLRVWLYLGHYANNCNVILEKFMTPVLTAPLQGVQEQSIDLKTFTVANSCGLPTLDVWNELQNYPVAKLEFNVPDINNKVPTGGTDIYTTSVTMGQITFK